MTVDRLAQLEANILAALGPAARGRHLARRTRALAEAIAECEREEARIARREPSEDRGERFVMAIDVATAAAAQLGLEIEFRPGRGDLAVDRVFCPADDKTPPGATEAFAAAITSELAEQHDKEPVPCQ